MRKIIFWGATGQARVLHEAIMGTDIRLVALVDNRQMPTPIKGVELLWGESGLDQWLEMHPGEYYFAIAVGGGRGADRLDLIACLKRKGLKPLDIIHSHAFVAKNATYGEGCQILAQAAVCANVKLGSGVIVNTSASVDHDSELADGVHIGPGARLAGEVTIGARSFVGTGAVVLPRIRIGEDAIVGAGAVVLKDVPPGVTVVGNPAKILVKN